MNTIYALIACGFSLTTASQALAQRVDDNAIADAEDAFGSNDGGEDLGLYGPFDVRGFSPIDAGNVRIDGVYFDRQADLNPRLVDGNRIRVGPSAVTYAFPAPSGIVDYRLRTPGRDPRLSAVVQVNSFGGAIVEVDAALPIGDNLSIGGGVSQSRSEYASGNDADISHLAAIAHWRGGTDTDAKLFWSRTRIADEDIYPIILGDGRSTPPKIQRRLFLGQHWADVETERFNYGAIVRSHIAGFSMRAGMFRSVNDLTEGHSVFLQSAPIGQSALRSVSSYPGRRGSSTSGEFGIARELTTGQVVHGLQVLLRGRNQKRRYGGAQRLFVANASFGQPLYVERPGFKFGPQTTDNVRQWSMGLNYQATIETLGQISGGMQRLNYRKEVGTPAAVQPVSVDSPWLFNVAAKLNVAPQISFFGSYTQGLEESEVAPEIAVNRDEAPPALRTKQIDAGFTSQIGSIELIVGAFQIERPYYGVDNQSVFRQLGKVRHHGLEASITGSPLPGLTVVAGGTFLRTRLSGDEVTSGVIGDRPVDVPARKMVASLDWRPPSSKTSVDLAVEHIGPNTGDAFNRVRVDPYTTIDVGLRHRFNLGRVPAAFRIQATNLLNAYGWEVAGNNAFVYNQSRQISARLTVDL